PASAVAGPAVRSTARQPAVVGSPSTSTRSLTATRGPLPDPAVLVMKVDTSEPLREGGGGLLAVLRAAKEHNLAVSEPPPVLPRRSEPPRPCRGAARTTARSRRPGEPRLREVFAQA